MGRVLPEERVGREVSMEGYEIIEIWDREIDLYDCRYSNLNTFYTFYTELEWNVYSNYTVALF